MNVRRERENSAGQRIAAPAAEGRPLGPAGAPQRFTRFNIKPVLFPKETQTVFRKPKKGSLDPTGRVEGQRRGSTFYEAVKCG
jgi:hypothetical protein